MADAGVTSSSSALALLEQLGAFDLQRAGARVPVPAQRSPGSSRRASTEHALLPAGIADDRSRAVMRLLSHLSALDLAPVLVYHVDIVPASALYALAWQFGVTGAAGWDLADTEAKQRDLLRHAIELHRHAGTPWVIKTVLATLGYDVTIEEGVGRPTYDGSARYDGALDYSAGAAWAFFRVLLGAVADDVAIDGARVEQIGAVIEAWKNARSQLTGVVFDTPSTAERTGAGPRDTDMQIQILEYFVFDGTLRYDGAAPYGPRTSGATVATDTHPDAVRAL